MDLKTIFNPRTVAVIGVSLKNDNHPANVIYQKNSLRHQADVFPVNGKGGSLHGDKVYARVSEIPKKISNGGTPGNRSMAISKGVFSPPDREE